MHGTDSEGKRIIYAIPNGLAGIEKAAFRRCYIDEDGQFKVDEGIDIRFYMRDISDRGNEGTCEQDGKKYDKKKQEICMDRICSRIRKWNDQSRRMSQFGGVYYRIGVDWESDIEKGTFFFYEIDGEQIERGYLPEEITLEF